MHGTTFHMVGCDASDFCIHDERQEVHRKNYHDTIAAICCSGNPVVGVIVHRNDAPWDGDFSEHAWHPCPQEVTS